MHAVTGAFGYSGHYIARRLLAAGHEVRTLTNSKPSSAAFAARVAAHPLDFSKPDQLTASLRGVRVL